MASIVAPPFRQTSRERLGDVLLSALVLVLLAVLLVALARGRAQWGLLPWPVWAHLVTVVPAMVLTPAMLLRRKADRLHRRLGYAWVALMGDTALISLLIRGSGPLGLSPIHVLSIWTLLMLWWIVAAARAHEPLRHRRRVRGLVIGGLLIAGVFTLPFGRVLGTWLAA